MELSFCFSYNFDLYDSIENTTVIVVFLALCIRLLFFHTKTNIEKLRFGINRNSSRLYSWASEAVPHRGVQQLDLSIPYSLVNLHSLIEAEIRFKYVSHLSPQICEHVTKFLRAITNVKSLALSSSFMKVSDILYDAEDVLDEFHCEALRKQVVNHSSISLKVRRLASFSFPLAFSVKMVHKIRRINQRLHEISTEWERFNLGVEGDNRCVIRRETHSFVISSDVISRDVDRENIINLLMKPNDGASFPLIPIVGIGGLGKTALTQFVYNDVRVKKLFPLKMWVCISEDFDLTRLLKVIIQSVDEEKKCDDLTLEALQTRLRSLLTGKKFLLVLDDVWNEDRVKWIELRDLLMSPDDLSESKIIVITRSLKVASIMSSIHPYELKGLPHEDCLTLFTKWALMMEMRDNIQIS